MANRERERTVNVIDSKFSLNFQSGCQRTATDSHSREERLRIACARTSVLQLLGPLAILLALLYSRQIEKLPLSKELRINIMSACLVLIGITVRLRYLNNFNNKS